MASEGKNEVEVDWSLQGFETSALRVCVYFAHSTQGPGVSQVDCSYSGTQHWIFTENLRYAKLPEHLTHCTFQVILRLYQLGTGL